MKWRKNWHWRRWQVGGLLSSQRFSLHRAGHPSWHAKSANDFPLDFCQAEERHHHRQIPAMATDDRSTASGGDIFSQFFPFCMIRFTWFHSFDFLSSCEGGRCYLSYRCAMFEANKYIKNMGKDIETGFDVRALGRQRKSEFQILSMS